MSVLVARAVREQLYGSKKEMPFIIGPAVSAAIATTTVLTVATAVAAVATVAGVAMTVVGAITGNSDLMKIGGILGLAGGVTGLATSVIGGATSAATSSLGSAAAAQPAAGSAATEGLAGASGGLTGASGANMVASVTPTTLETALPASNSVLGSATTAAGSGNTGILGTSGSAALQSVAPTASAQGIGSSIGASASAPAVASQSASFFDALTTPQNLMEIGKVGASMMQGSAQEEMYKNMMDQKNAVDYAKLDFQKQMYDTQQANANAQGRMNISSKAPTQEELDAYAQQKAQQAKNMANILTQPAGAK